MLPLRSNELVDIRFAERWLLPAALLSSFWGCGRIGFDAQGLPGKDGDLVAVVADASAPDSDALDSSTIDASGNSNLGELADLCLATGTDVDNDGIPDACDPCVDIAQVLDCGQEHGTSRNGFPSWEERVLLMGINAIRADHVGYRDAYMVFTDATGSNVFASGWPSLPPFQYRQRLATGARFYAENAVTCPTAPTGQVLCDGTPWATWRAPYAPISGFAAYPFYFSSKGVDHPLYMVSAFACGQANTAPGNRTFRSCVDDSNSLRRLLFESTTHTNFGPGHAAVETTDSYWEGLLSSEAIAFFFPIASAGHWFWEGDITFGMNIETSSGVSAAHVVIDGVRQPMALQLGTSTRGFYRNVGPTETGCRSYYFILVDAEDAIWRYPTTGTLETTGEGGCTDTWLP